jgi:WD40 repeat protein
MVTASHDKTVILYKQEEQTEETGESSPPSSSVRMKMTHKLNLKEVPEDVIFCLLPADFTTLGTDTDVDMDMGGESSELKTARLPCLPPSRELQLHLIVPTRGACHLLYINCATLRHRKVSLNEQAWDRHVSFNVLHMSLSPNGRQLLVATDKDFHLVLKTGTNQRLSLLAGHMCNDYGKPKTAWDVTGKYVFSNNQADHNILVYAVNTGKIVATLCGHRGQVRDIKSHSSERTVLTASYDHTVKEWCRV